jgi:sugar phosphate permease
VFGGMTFLSTAQPIFLSANTLICNRWFSDKERGLATALSGLSLPFGCLISFIFTGVNFADVEQGNDQSVKDSLN